VVELQDALKELELTRDRNDKLEHTHRFTSTADALAIATLRSENVKLKNEIRRLEQDKKIREQEHDAERAKRAQGVYRLEKKPKENVEFVEGLKQEVLNLQNQITKLQNEVESLRSGDLERDNILKRELDETKQAVDVAWAFTRVITGSFEMVRDILDRNEKEGDVVNALQIKIFQVRGHEQIQHGFDQVRTMHIQIYELFKIIDSGIEVEAIDTWRDLMDKIKPGNK
jgi:hypothetical protein